MYTMHFFEKQLYLIDTYNTRSNFTIIAEKIVSSKIYIKTILGELIY